MSALLAPQANPALEVTNERMAAAGLRAFARIALAWDLSVDEQLVLLGQPPRSTFFAWRKHPEKATLPRDTLERLSNILGIYKSLQILLPDAEAADRWVRKPNSAPPFAGSSALARMLAGNVSDLNLVRRYLDGVRGGGWSCPATRRRWPKKPPPTAAKRQAWKCAACAGSRPAASCPRAIRRSRCSTASPMPRTSTRCTRLKR